METDGTEKPIWNSMEQVEQMEQKNQFGTAWNKWNTWNNLKKSNHVKT
jgi:hypothetical protein